MNLPNEKILKVVARFRGNDMFRFGVYYSIELFSGVPIYRGSYIRKLVSYKIAVRVGGQHVPYSSFETFWKNWEVLGVNQDVFKQRLIDNGLLVDNK